MTFPGHPPKSAKLQAPTAILCQNTADVFVIVFPWVPVEMGRKAAASVLKGPFQKLELALGLVPWLKNG
jgi:hypothetical protein